MSRQAHDSTLCMDFQCQHPYCRELNAYIVFNNLCEKLSCHSLASERRVMILGQVARLVAAFPFLSDLVPAPDHYKTCTLSARTNCHHTQAKRKFFTRASSASTASIWR